MPKKAKQKKVKVWVVVTSRGGLYPHFYWTKKSATYGDVFWKSEQYKGGKILRITLTYEA